MIYNFNVLMLDSIATPIRISELTSVVKMAVVERAGARSPNKDWDKTGIYILLDPPLLDGTWSCYVGKANGVTSRLKNHIKNKEHWSRALLVIREDEGFNSAHAAYLEGKVYKLLKTLPQVTLHNGNQPKDNTLKEYEQTGLDSFVHLAFAALRLLGYNTSTSENKQTSTFVAHKNPADTNPLNIVKRASKDVQEKPTGAKTEEKRRKSPMSYGIALEELVKAGLVKEGETLTSLSSVRPGTANVGTNGKIVFEGVDYTSISAAAKASCKLQAVNGWSHWGVERNGALVSLEKIRAEYIEKSVTKNP